MQLSNSVRSQNEIQALSQEPRQTSRPRTPSRPKPGQTQNPEPQFPSTQASQRPNQDPQKSETPPTPPHDREEYFKPPCGNQNKTNARKHQSLRSRLIGEPAGGCQTLFQFYPSKSIFAEIPGRSGRHGNSGSIYMTHFIRSRGACRRGVGAHCAIPSGALNPRSAEGFV